MKNTDNDILKIQKQWLSDLRTQYLSTVRGMTVSEKDGAEYWENRGEAKCILDKVFTLFGFDAAEGLQEDGFREWNRIRGKGVTLSAILSLLRPYEHVSVMRSIGPRELEDIGGGTVRELQTIKSVEKRGECEVERMELTVDEPIEDWIGRDTPVLMITISGQEAEL